MIDYADKDWLKRPLITFPIDNGLLDPKFSPKADPSVDLEYKIKAQRAWEKARDVGTFGGHNG